MIRRLFLRSVLPTLLLLAGAVPLLAQSAACPGGRAPRGDVGIRALRCTGPGASCAINLRHGGHHEFAVEPVVTAVDESRAGEGGPQAGDTLVAVDGLLITTREGGRRLADPPLGRRVALLVRRGGTLLGLSVRPTLGCGVSSLRVVQ